MNLGLDIDRSQASSLQDQIVHDIQVLIATGKLKANSRIQGSRNLAEQLGVSRTTVLIAYERLIAEGFLETRPTVGTFVSAKSPVLLSGLTAGHPQEAVSGPAPAPEATCEHPGAFGAVFVDFRAQHEDGAHIPNRRVWMEGLRAALKSDIGGLERSCPPEGDARLRRSVAGLLALTRGLEADPERIIIVTGLQQACTLVAHVLLHRGDRVLFEAPGEDATLDVFRRRGCDLLPAAIDAGGLMPHRLPAGPVRLAHVSPARHPIYGMPLARKRRNALAAWTRGADAYLLEDDRDSLMRYRGAIPKPLSAEELPDRSFYFGSFSNTLGAGLSLGFLVAPERYCGPLAELKSMGGDLGGVLEQRIVAELIDSGAYENHIRRIRKTYLERRDTLLTALRRTFGEARVFGAESGSQIAWSLPDTLPDATEIWVRAREVGVALPEPATSYGETDVETGRLLRRTLILSYSGLDCAAIRQGVERLAQAVLV